MKDLTKIKTPFGLLGKKTRKALVAHGGPYEMYTDDGWGKLNHPSWAVSGIYRVEPTGPVTPVLSPEYREMFEGVIARASGALKGSTAQFVPLGNISAVFKPITTTTDHDDKAMISKRVTSVNLGLGEVVVKLGPGVSDLIAAVKAWQQARKHWQNGDDFGELWAAANVLAEIEVPE